MIDVSTEPAPARITSVPLTGPDPSPTLALDLVLRLGTTRLTLASLTDADVLALASIEQHPTLEAVQALIASVRARGVRVQRSAEPVPCEPEPKKSARNEPRVKNHFRDLHARRAEHRAKETSR